MAPFSLVDAYNCAARYLPIRKNVHFITSVATEILVFDFELFIGGRCISVRRKLLCSNVCAANLHARRNRDGLPFRERPPFRFAVEGKRDLRAELLQVAVREF